MEKIVDMPILKKFMMTKNLRMYGDIRRVANKMFGTPTIHDEIVERLNLIHLENVSLGHYDM